MSREIETEEIRKRFLEWVCSQIDSASKKEGQIPLRELLEMYTFQLLSVLDSGILKGKPLERILPAFILAPCSTEDDRKWSESNGQDYFPDNAQVAETIKGDISGVLHEQFMTMRNRS